jgi:hypothetical protein
MVSRLQNVLAKNRRISLTTNRIVLTLVRLPSTIRNLDMASIIPVRYQYSLV